jgi:carboxypeptidase C (cathepsin A)
MTKRYSSRHTVTVGGEELRFEAIAERIALTDDADGTRLGHAWTFAYVREPADRTRPVLFLFNGGPGVASVWLHLSGLGPWRAVVPEDVTAAPTASGFGAGGAALAPSEHTLLDVADLVLIDPVETGFGRVADGVDLARVSGADRDAALTAQLVQRWLQRHGRLESPVFLLGESYGTIRAPLTATALHADENIVVSGVAMLGQCLNAQETTQRPGNAAGFVAALPLLAATAWYHGKSAHASLTLDEVVREAHTFAVGDYAAALSAGEASAQLIDRLAGFTGLDAETLRARRLRIDKEEYRRLLLADRGEVLGLTDARYTLPAAAAGASEPHVDATSVRVDPVYGAAVHALFAELGLPARRRYRFASPAHERWNYLESSAIGKFGGSNLPSPFAIFDYPAHLGALLRANSDARLFFGTGHFDTLTTVGSLEHLKSQYGLPVDRISEGRYPAGHMMYTDETSLAALSADLRAFLRG